jgi:mono/diheme cytochrome c family protein
VSANPRAPVFRTILARYNRDVLTRELVDGMTVAHAPMPQFKFDPKGTDALVAYLQSIQVSSPGRNLVEEKCARCHAIGRTDTSPYPGAQPFRNLGERWTRDQLTQALRTGIVAEHDRSGVRLEMKLNDREIVDLLDFLRSIETRDQPAPH